jgi:hypothetical protein
VLGAGTLALCWLSLAGAYDIVAGTRWSLLDQRSYRKEKTALLESLVTRIPKDALVYTETHDKVLWRHWRVGMIDAPENTAKSIARAVGARLDVYTYEPLLKPRTVKQLERALRREGLELEPPRTRGLRRVVSRAPAR